MALSDLIKAPSATSRLFGAVAHWNDARRTRDALSQLTGRELEDIGLTRGDIDAIVRKVAL